MHVRMMTVVAALLCGVAGAETIDLGKLGAKGDGSEDISALVNANTGKGSLFLPAGVYKVSHPLVLRNPLFGTGYSRTPTVDATRTWLVSDIACTNGEAGVIEFGGSVRVNVENVNILCHGRECGIRVGDCRQATAAYVSHVGIFGVRSFGFRVEGKGSRPIFAGDMTIWGAFGHTERSVALRVKGACDCRFSNIEAMGVCVGMEAFNGHTYCDNLHLWTGCLGRSGAAWWKQTRGIVLGAHANFAGSEIYPDTCYYAIEETGPGTICEISNIMYWEDGSVPKDCDRDGAFLKRHPDGSGRLIVHGGLVGVGGNDKRPGWMNFVYSPAATFADVMMKCEYAIAARNIDRLCLGRELPDYTVSYATNAFCKVADILTVARTGACHALLVRDDGAAWRLGFVRGKEGETRISVKPMNELGTSEDVKTVSADDHVKVFLRAPDKASWSARLTTNYMGERFRPVDHGSLRDHGGNVRYRETL